MNCIYLKVRSKKFEKYIYCSKRKEQIKYEECRSCKGKEYKQVSKIKRQSNKQRRLESKRFSLLTDNLNVCFICGQKRKEDLHEVFGGCNRKKSIEWGLVIPVCRKCHDEWDISEKIRSEIQIKAQEFFEKQYSQDSFMTEFGQNYKEKWKNNRTQLDNKG